MKHANYNSGGNAFQKVNLDIALKAPADPGNGSDLSVSPFKYKYNVKEYRDELGLNMYDYGARNYDPALGRWMNIDGMSEKYLSNSPYHYANNNPVLNYDVDGNYFSNMFSLFTALTYRNHLNDQINSNNASITEMQNMLNKGGQSQSSVAFMNSLMSTLNNSNSEMQSSINEISVLIDSNQAYTIEDAGAFANSGQASYDKSSRSVNIKAPLGKGFGLLGHELKHAYQFEIGTEGLAYSGEIRFQPINMIGIDITDEWNAYKIQNSIEPGTGYDSYNELLNDSTGPYSNHPRNQSSVSDHARIQAILRLNGSDTQNKKALNDASTSTRIAFRINKITYDGNN